MDDALANLAGLTLRHGRYSTRHATDLTEGRRLLREWAPHLMILDIDHFDRFFDLVRGPAGGRPGILGFTRKRDTAVKLGAYERGLDDIFEVPFTLDEIVARSFALVRRAHGIEVELVPTIRFDHLEVDLMQGKVKVGENWLQLGPLQQTLLYLLAANAGKALSRELILNSIWGQELEVESNVVDRHIRELRVKLGDSWRDPQFIETVPGQGYRYRTKDDEFEARLAPPPPRVA
jgi:DNA-binding response OmpR family regulator